MIIESVIGGTVVGPSGLERADVLIDDDGSVAAVVAPDGAPAGGHVLDASGCYVLPGGVDPHCHAMSSVADAARAAAVGGTTTILSFTNPDEGESAASCLERRIETIGEARPAVDIGLHAMAGDPERLSRSEITALRQAGASAIKVFLAYRELGIMCTTERLYHLMTWARELDMIVQVHCENGPLIECLHSAGVAAGADGLRLFHESRPPEVEEEAVARTIMVAALTGATAYLVHLSSAGAVDQVRLARQKGRAQVLAEVCLHHLVLDRSLYDRPDAERFLVVPPLRQRSDAEALWRAIGDGTVNTVGSDHAQLRSLAPAEPAGSGDGYHYGLAGVGARLPVMLAEGLSRGLAITRLVDLLSTAPARAFGHYPRKGVVAAGSDADLVVFDPGGETRITPESFEDRTGDSVYSGRTVPGRLRAVVLRGHLVSSDGALVEAESGHGRYLGSAAAPA
jgi:dihydropyrimidinase